MKIAGIDLDKPAEIVIPIIRGEEEVFFKAACILNFDEMDTVLIEPTPPTVMHRGEGVSVPVLKDPKYLASLEDYSSKRIAWMVSKSLLATDGLEWSSVDFSNPDTWTNYEVELKAVGFNEFQIGQLVRGVMEANGLSDERIKEARKRFLALGQEQKLLNSLPVEQPNISSGDSANDSV